MSTGRTTDDRDRDSRRHREIIERLERIEERLDIIDQRTRQAPGARARHREASEWAS